MSAGQFTRARPTERLANLLDATGCAPSMIGLEITETAILPDVQAAARSRSRARGSSASRSRSTTSAPGHSSLTLLRSLPIDRVKIDQTFVRELGRDAAGDGDRPQRDQRGASDLGIEVVAEGVETPAQAEVLAELGCQFAQGYLWAKAMPLGLDELTRRPTPLVDDLHGVGCWLKS